MQKRGEGVQIACNDAYVINGRPHRENGQKNPCQGKHRKFRNFAKTQGIWFAEVVNSLIAMILQYLLWNFSKSVSLLKKAQGNFPDGRVKAQGFGK